MNLENNIIEYVRSLTVYGAVAVLVLMLSCGFIANRAFAAETDSPLCMGVHFCRLEDASGVDPQPSSEWYIAVEFDSPVSYDGTNDGSLFATANAEKVHLQFRDGSDVDGSYAYSNNTRSGNRTIYISTNKWLAPLTNYRVFIEPGIVSNSGIASRCSIAIAFTTNANTPSGLTVYQLIAIAVIIIVCVAGSIVALCRKKHA